MIIVRKLDERRWAEFVQNHPNGNIFHTPEIYLVFAQALRYLPTLWAVLDREEQILTLLLPVQISLFYGLLKYFGTRAISYGSVLTVPGLEGQRALAMLLQAYKRDTAGHLLFTELRNLSDLESIRPTLRESGFEFEAHLNYVIELELTPEATFENIGQRTRRNIRRALRTEKVVVTEVTTIEQVANCYEILQRTYRKARVLLADRSLFESAFKLLRLKGMIRFTLASVYHVPVATSMELLNKKVAYGW